MVCLPSDIVCSLKELVAAFLFPIVIFLVLIFVVPKAGWKGVVISVVGIFVILWWYGLIPGLPALRGF